MKRPVVHKPKGQPAPVCNVCQLKHIVVSTTRIGDMIQYSPTCACWQGSWA